MKALIPILFFAFSSAMAAEPYSSSAEYYTNEFLIKRSGFDGCRYVPVQYDHVKILAPDPKTGEWVNVNKEYRERGERQCGTQ